MTTEPKPSPLTESVALKGDEGGARGAVTFENSDPPKASDEMYYGEISHSDQISAKGDGGYVGRNREGVAESGAVGRITLKTRNVAITIG